ncbi:MAG: glycosyltransferase family 8 protein, partial [Bacilli bacterium]|nr:glycosyltransferase family 8 protein [Bacilli bacterium]
MKRERIPVFFAVDNNYIDYLVITLTSIIDNAKDERFRYNFIVLHNGLSIESKKKVNKLVQKRFRVTYINVGPSLNQIQNRFKLRDYYTMTTYYRLLIPDTFFYFDKAIYLDCDIVVLGDLSKLYKVELGDNLVAAVPDASVQIVPEFITYVNEALMIKKENYFNAGVLLMNLKKMRSTHLLRRVLELSKTVAFKVAQDQDLLNVICKDMVTYLPTSWNVMPIGPREVDINLIHYNLIYKPWKRNNIMYQEHFWHYASKADLEVVVKERLDEMDEEFIKREDEG